MMPILPLLLSTIQNASGDLNDDNNLFEIDSEEGVVTFKDSPDYDNPTDADGDNQYQVYVSAESNSEFYQSFTITITDLEEAPYYSLASK